MYSVTVMAGLLADQRACFTTVLCYAYAAIQSHAEKKAFSHMLVYTTPKRPMGEISQDLFSKATVFLSTIEVWNRLLSPSKCSSSLPS